MRTRLIRKTNNEHGVTLIEALVSLAIFMLIGMGLFNFQQDFFRANNWVQGALTRETQINKVFRDFVKEVRSASTASNGAYLIEASASTSFIFFADLNGDGNRERIRYFISGSSLQKGITKPTGCPGCAYVPGNETVQTIATEVTNTASVFSYYDVNYDGSQTSLSQPVSPSAVRLVKIQLTIDPNGSLPPPPQTFETEASIRNLRQL